VDSYQPKLIYLTRRHPSLSREGFRSRWRKHGSLGMSRPRWRNIARYVHCDLELPRPGMESLFGDHDGVGLIWHRSAEHRAAHRADAHSQSEMEADEAETFARPIGEVCLLAREEIVRAPAPGASWKLLRFAATSDAPPPLKDAAGHVRNHPLPPESGERWGLDCAMVEEYWFFDREHAEAAASSLRGDALLVLGRDTLLYP
jgi:hypothetical protein